MNLFKAQQSSKTQRRKNPASGDTQLVQSDAEPHPKRVKRQRPGLDNSKLCLGNPELLALCFAIYVFPYRFDDKVIVRARGPRAHSWVFCDQKWVHVSHEIWCRLGFDINNEHLRKFWFDHGSKFGSESHLIRMIDERIPEHVLENEEERLKERDALETKVRATLMVRKGSNGIVGDCDDDCSQCVEQKKKRRLMT